MEFPRIDTNDWSRDEMVSDTGRYSGPEPQPLPLPPELIVRTLSYLEEIHDRQNARLACKGFAACGLPSLTSTVYFSTSLINKCDVPKGPCFSSRTKDIAMHPVVSKYITRMVCDGTQLPNDYFALNAFRIWWAALGKQPTWQWPTEKVHDMYVSKFNQDHQIITMGEDRKIFRMALECFVHLKSILFTDVASDEHNRTLPRPKWPPTIFEDDLWGPSSPYHTFAMCIRSLSEMAIKLHELTIEGKTNAMSHLIFSQASPSNYQHLLNVFASLRKTSVKLMCSDDDPLNFAGIGRVLTHAKLLRSLDFKCMGTYRHKRLVLSRLFQNFTWPHLKHLGLHGFTLYTDVDLVSLFDRHRTLNSAALRSMYLHQQRSNPTDESPCEAWKHFFCKLRERKIKLEALDLFELYDCANYLGLHPELAVRANWGAYVVHYLRHGGANPLVRVTWDEVSE